MTNPEKEATIQWEMYIAFLYDRNAYVKGLDRLLKKNNVKRVLDSSCGTGFPAIDLKKLGYGVVAADASKEMLKRFRENCERENVEIETHKAEWSELPKLFGGKFDAVLCRGNSLPYADSWAKADVNIDRTRTTIRDAIKAFYSVIRPGGLLYTDLHPRKSFTSEHALTIERFKPKTINGKEVELAVKMENDLKTGVRNWQQTCVMKKKGKTIRKLRLHFKAYHQRHNELVEFMKQAGFSKIRSYAAVEGENTYDVFIGHKVG